MNEGSTIAPDRHWVATPEEARLWGTRQWERAQASSVSQGYFPRYKHRYPGNDGRPAERHVKVAASLVFPPQAVVNSVTRQAQRAMAPVMDSGKVRFLDRGVIHLTHHFIYPGANEAEDRANVAVARAVAPRVGRVAKEFKPMALTMDGLTITDRQLMVTYRGDQGWNAFLDSAAHLEEEVPEFWNAYNLKSSPLEEGGRALNTTLAVFEEGIDMKKLADAIEPFLPGNGGFAPLPFVARDLRLVLQEFDSTYVQRISETLAHAPFQGPSTSDLLSREHFCGRSLASNFGRG